MDSNGPFKGRSISVVNDLSVDEQIYLYNKTRELKNAVKQREDLTRFIIGDLNVAIYLIFLENSTRTKESFRNAAGFHRVKLNTFDAEFSSLNKKESYSDTFKMLCGYSEYSIFIIRSRLEGVCRWLDLAMEEYGKRNQLVKPSFINAGDGKHEHPTQEFLDEYSFYEQQNWDLSHIHIALIGDLYHGRTTHSKVDGLRIFSDVEVDLIAPEELAMPDHYLEKMRNNGFHLRIFSNVLEYISQKKIADSWYFTRLQLERMGEDVLEKADQLREAVTFKRDLLDRIPDGTKFYHPLPRHREHPTIPFFLDETPLNGWETQAINGYYTRIIELGMLGGILGKDFQGRQNEPQDYSYPFIQEANPSNKKKPAYKMGFIPVSDGIVIDHIGKGDDIDTIWDHINNIRRMLDLNAMGSHGVFRSLKDGRFKGMVALPEVKEFDAKKLKKLAAIAPGCTLNIIRDQRVLHKYRLHTPPRIYNFKEISCKNPDCISHPAHDENAMTVFFRSSDNTFTCQYCERPHTFREIWNL
ncbi:MAG TPA: bifunctional aspartate carbamoyltransferase catalytic subunit/aspartate carbamoyltransferase regulatory subunit [Spirochaetia bacterium]|nr:bifunctional aspartate carbamoyltransferase catalytic subunit/aspartate carbamoyltransferase regulatory subunit [Spirochaetia bacterium]